MPTTHIVTMSLSRDNASIKKQKYAHSSDFVMRFLRPSVKRPRTEKDALDKGLWRRRTDQILY